MLLATSERATTAQPVYLDEAITDRVESAAWVRARVICVGLIVTLFVGSMLACAVITARDAMQRKARSHELHNLLP